MIKKAKIYVQNLPKTSRKNRKIHKKVTFQKKEKAMISEKFSHIKKSEDEVCPW